MSFTGTTWRELREADLEACFAVQPSVPGDDLVGRDETRRVWGQLLKNPAFVARVIEARGAGESRVIGLGASVFVEPAFLKRETSDPRPGLAARAIAALAAGEPVLLAEDAIARANGGDGIDAVFLSFVWWRTSTSAEFSEMMLTCIGSCVEAHAGYRLRTALVECPGEIRTAIGGHSGAFEVVREFPGIDIVWLRMTRERALAAPASPSNLLFQYREPVLGLTAAHRRLLDAALGGAPDRELALKLRLPLSAVKNRWRSIVERVWSRMPELFAEIAADQKLKRGPQKRHLILSYVRQHMEELRPYRAR